MTPPGDLLAAPGLAETAGLLATGGAAGLAGSVLGVGGGVVIVPVLTLLYGVPVRLAVAASLVGVAATSASSAGAYFRQGRVDVPLALELEVATAAGAVAAGVLAPFVPEGGLYLAFAAVVLYAAREMARRAAGGASDGGGCGGGGGAGDASAGDAGARGATNGGRSVGPASAGGAAAGYGPAREATAADEAEAAGEAAEGRGPPGSRGRRGWGLAGMTGAGVAAGLLGIGGGFAKVPVMNAVMGVRLPVATATSTFMVGMTAASSAWVYWARGDVRLVIAAPVALGVLAGGTLGARLSRRMPDRWIRTAFVLLLLYIAAQMAWRGFTRVAG